MHRPARLVAATLVVTVLAGAPAAAATASLAQTAPSRVQPAASVSPDTGHDGHTTGADVAEWPEWARTDSEQTADDGHAHSHHVTPAAADSSGAAHGTGHDTGHETGGGAGDGDGDRDTSQQDDADSHGDHCDETGPAPERPRALVLGTDALRHPSHPRPR